MQHNLSLVVGTVAMISGSCLYSELSGEYRLEETIIIILILCLVLLSFFIKRLCGLILKDNALLDAERKITKSACFVPRKGAYSEASNEGTFVNVPKQGGNLTNVTTIFKAFN